MSRRLLPFVRRKSFPTDGSLKKRPFCSLSEYLNADKVTPNCQRIQGQMNLTGPLFSKIELKMKGSLFFLHCLCPRLVLDFLFFLLAPAYKVLQVLTVEELTVVSRRVLHDIAPLPMGIASMCIVGGSKHTT